MGRNKYPNGMGYVNAGGPGSALSSVMKWALQSNVITSATIGSLPASHIDWNTSEVLAQLINDLRAKRVIEPDS